MAGCMSSVIVWLLATAALFRYGAYAEFETVAIVIGAAAMANWVLLSLVWLAARKHQARLIGEYIRLYGPLPEEMKASGTRVGGTAGRVLGGSTGYLIGGVIGAVADAYQEQQKYQGMSEPQLSLLHEIGRLKLVRPLINSVMMVGALIGSWLLVVIVNL